MVIIVFGLVLTCTALQYVINFINGEVTDSLLPLSYRLAFMFI